MSRSGTRLAVAIATAALSMGLSYMVQRLWDASSEPPMTAVRRMAMIPYYWRVGAAVLHGCVAGTVCWVALPEPTDRAMDRLAAAGLLLTAMGSATMLAVP